MMPRNESILYRTTDVTFIRHLNGATIVYNTFKLTSCSMLKHLQLFVTYDD